MLPKIMTANIYPPIPIRIFDWIAWFDSYGEEGPTGSGPTEQAAIADLMATQGLTPGGKCSHCGKMPEAVNGCAVGGCPIGEDA